MTATKPGPTETGGGDKRQSEIDERLDRELAETFPASDPPSVTSPAAGEEPKPRDEDRPNAAGKTDGTPA